MTSQTLADETAVCEWLKMKPTGDNKAMVYETIIRFLDSEDGDGQTFNEVPRSEAEILEWVADHLERQYEYGDTEDEEGRAVVAFCKKAIKSLWKTYRHNAEMEKIVLAMQGHDFIEKILFDEQAKKLPEGTTTWTMEFKSRSGRSHTKHYAVKNGKWVRV